MGFKKFGQIVGMQSQLLCQPLYGNAVVQVGKNVFFALLHMRIVIGMTDTCLPAANFMHHLGVFPLGITDDVDDGTDIVHLENGEKTEMLNTRIPVEDVPIYLRLSIEGRRSFFAWSYDGEQYERIGRVFDTTCFSDEYCKYGEFTGTFVGMTCADRVRHKHYADFDFFEYKADEDAAVD